MTFFYIFDVLIYKEFLLPLVLAAITAYQTIRINTAQKQKTVMEDRLKDLQTKAEEQKTIFDMLERYENEYAELTNKYLELRKLYNEKERDSDFTGKIEDSLDEV